MNTNNWLNENFPYFGSLNKELSPGFCLLDIFSNCFSFYSVNQKNSDTKFAYCNKLDNIYKNSPMDQSIVLIVMIAFLYLTGGCFIDNMCWGLFHF